MSGLLTAVWSKRGGPDIAGYAVTLAVILAIVAGMVKLVRSSANNGFSASASSIQ